MSALVEVIRFFFVRIESCLGIPSSGIIWSRMKCRRPLFILPLICYRYWLWLTYSCYIIMVLLINTLLHYLEGVRRSMRLTVSVVRTILHEWDCSGLGLSGTAWFIITSLVVSRWQWLWLIMLVESRSCAISYHLSAFPHTSLLLCSFLVSFSIIDMSGSTSAPLLQCGLSHQIRRFFRLKLRSSSTFIILKRLEVTFRC